MSRADYGQPQTSIALEMLADPRFHAKGCQPQGKYCACGMAANLGMVEAEARTDLDVIRAAARRHLDAIGACRAASDAALRDKGAVEALEDGYLPLDLALAYLSEAESRLRELVADD